MRYAQIGRWLNYLFSPRRSWQSQSLSNCHYMKLADRSDRIPPVLHEWFIEMFPETEAWFAARLRYTRSTAVMSMVGYVLGYVHPFTSIDMYKANCRIPQTWWSTWRELVLWRGNRWYITRWFQLSLWQGSSSYPSKYNGIIWPKKGQTLAKPEVVPFRLTQNMIDAFGAYGYNGGILLLVLRMLIFS